MSSWPGYPFRLRFGPKEGERLAKPAAMTGTITTPWRVILVGADLNALVQSDLIPNVAPPPDPKLFPRGPATEWIKPGRCVWKYLDGGPSTLEGMKEFSRLAGQLGFEYHLVEGFWQRWSDKELGELVTYSRRHNVGIWLWKHSKDIRDPAQRRAFFEKCRDAGVVGVKLDFFDHEAREVIDLYHAAPRDAAACRRAAFARRSGNRWFVAVLNGPDAKEIRIPLPFLGKGAYDVLAVRDVSDDAAAVGLTRSSVGRSDALTIGLRAGGGFIARLSPAATAAFGGRP